MRRPIKSSNDVLSSLCIEWKHHGTVDWKKVAAFFRPCNTRVEANFPCQHIILHASYDAGATIYVSSLLQSRKVWKDCSWWSQISSTSKFGIGQFALFVGTFRGQRSIIALNFASEVLGQRCVTACHDTVVWEMRSLSLTSWLKYLSK